MDNKVAGAILTGGRSTRLKTDKTKLCLHGDGTDLLHQTYACVHSIIQECWLVCRKDQSALDLPCIFDKYENAGPMAGIVAALSQAKDLGYKAILALSCDLPLMQPVILQKLLATWMIAPKSLATTFFNRRTNKLETLATIYSTEALPLFTRAIEKGYFRLNAIIPWGCTTVVFTDAETEMALFNVNTPEDLAMAQAMLSNRKSPTKTSLIGLSWAN